MGQTFISYTHKSGGVVVSQRLGITIRFQNWICLYNLVLKWACSLEITHKNMNFKWQDEWHKQQYRLNQLNQFSQLRFRRKKRRMSDNLLVFSWFRLARHMSQVLNNFLGVFRLSCTRFSPKNKFQSLKSSEKQI